MFLIQTSRPICFLSLKLRKKFRKARGILQTKQVGY